MFRHHRIRAISRFCFVALTEWLFGILELFYETFYRSVCLKPKVLIIGNNTTVIKKKLTFHLLVYVACALAHTRHHRSSRMPLISDSLLTCAFCFIELIIKNIRFFTRVHAQENASIQTKRTVFIHGMSFAVKCHQFRYPVSFL